MSSLLDWFSGPGFMPHGHCYLWRPEILWLHVGSDAAIALAYFSIPAALIYFVRRRRDLAFSWVFLLFGGFILWCGLTHAFNIWTTWQPVYLAEGVVKLATAAVSVATALVIWPLMPRILALPSPAQLEAANARYRALNTELERRVHERTLELERAVEALRRSNTELEHFASLLDHEIRQPVQTIQTSAQLIAELAPGLPSDADVALSRLQRGIRQLGDLIDAEASDARSLSREEAQAFVDLGGLVADVVDELRAPLADAQAEVEVGKLPPVQGNPVQLAQVFRNLVGNALKYRRDGGPLQLRIEALEREDQRVEIEVEDNGRGVDPRHAPRIFELFYRGETGERPGSGIGLAVCRRIVERHGGTIRLASTAGGGALRVRPAQRDGDPRAAALTGARRVVRGAAHTHQGGLVPAEALRDLLTKP